MTGNLEVGYISGETPMVVYLNVHMALEQMRQKIEKESKKLVGPKVNAKNSKYAAFYVLLIIKWGKKTRGYMSKNS